MSQISRYTTIYILLAIIISGLLLYFPSLHSTSFYFDDVSSVEHNPAIKHLDLPAIFKAFNTRSLAGLSFALNYAWCGLHPAGYRLINLLIHCLNAFLVFFLAKDILKCGHKIAFFGALLFLSHPIETEAVNYITQRFVLMGTFFYLLTLVLYIRKYRIASVLSALAAMFCKEFVITLPLMLVLYEFYFGVNKRSFAEFTPECFSRGLRMAIPYIIIALIVPILLISTPKETIGVANIAQSTDITKALGDISRKEYFLTELNVVRTYVRLLFIPINQNIDYDYPLSNSIDLKTFLSAAFLLSLFIIAYFTYASHRIISFSICWFFIALSVESSFIPIGHVIAEYRLYLASVGFILLISHFLAALQKNKKLFNIIAAVILIFCSVLTYQRNTIWKDDLSLWNDAVEKSPHKERPYNNRGLAWAARGNFIEALQDYSKAIELNPHYINAYINRGLLYDTKGQFSLALADFNKAIELNPRLAEVYNNLGNTYYYQNNLMPALSDFNKAISLNPQLAESYNDRANVFLKLNHIDQAISDYNRAIILQPMYADAYYNLAFLYYQEANLPQSLWAYNKVLEINPRDAQAQNNRAAVLQRISVSEGRR